MNARVSFGRLHGLRARIVAGAGANLAGQLVTAVVQLLSLPLFLHFWDTSRYGKWLMLSAIPTYFAMSDGGVVPVASNRITMLRAAGDNANANSVFQSALALVLVSIISIGGCSALVLALIPTRLIDTDSALALWILIVVTLVSLFGGLFDAGFRSHGNYSRGMWFGNGIRVLEFFGLAFGLVAGTSYTSAALGMLAGRCLGVLYVGDHCHRRFPDLKWSLANASGTELYALLRPGLAYLAFPIANGLSIQAVTLIIGSLFGPIVVATFNTYRTLSRLVLQAAAAFGHAVAAEFTRVYGSRDTVALRNLYRKGILLGAAISVAASIAMVPAAPYILSVWTNGKIGFDALLYILFAALTLVCGLSHVPRVLLVATNLHGRLSVFTIATCAFGLFSVYVAARIFGPEGAVIAMTAQECALLWLAMTLSQQVFLAPPAMAEPVSA